MEQEVLEGETEHEPISADAEKERRYRWMALQGIEPNAWERFMQVQDGWMLD